MERERQRERERERDYLWWDGDERDSEFEGDGGFIWGWKTEKGRVRGVKKPSFVSSKTGVDYLVKKKCKTDKFFTISCQNCHIVEYCDIAENNWWRKNGKFICK